MTDEKSFTGNAQLLHQALKSNDDLVLNSVMKITSPEMQFKLIEQLPANLLSNFFRSFSQYIDRHPNTLSAVLPWLEIAIEQKKTEITVSAELQRRITELQLVLKQRTQQIGLFIEANALSNFVHYEKEGTGIGLPILEDDVQIIDE